MPLLKEIDEQRITIENTILEIERISKTLDDIGHKIEYFADECSINRMFFIYKEFDSLYPKLRFLVSSYWNMRETSTSSIFTQESQERIFKLEMNCYYLRQDVCSIVQLYEGLS